MTSSTALARAVVAELVGGGVRHVVLCPGSRSAPLAYAFHDAAAGGLLHLHVRADERVAAFTALGLGRATGIPAVVVTTSGTAVANLHPAVLEAHHGQLPLIVLSADRPPRLRGTWANQTSDLQAGLLGAATRFAVDLTPNDPVSAWAAAAGEAVEAALGRAGPAGPAHLNLGFDEPLVPAEDDAHWRPSPVPTAGAAPPVAAPAGTGDEPSMALDATRRTVVVAGDRSGSLARAVAERFGLPLLAEPTSGARSGAHAVGPYRLLLDRPDLGGRIEQVVVFGRPTLSRPVTRLIERPDVDVLLVTGQAGDPGPERTDVRRVGPAQAEAWLERPAPMSAGGSGWLASWQRAGDVASRAVDSVLDGWPVLTGPLVAREVAAATAPDEGLVLAASNPVRDLDLAGRPWPSGAALLHANRGLSGIDGTVSTALGVALGSDRPSRVLVGDLAFLHDVGALALGPHEQRPDLTVIVVNDRGGGIFSLLEPGVDGERDEVSAARFERLFGTPQDLRPAEICAGLGVPHGAIASAAGLRERLAAPIRGLAVLEIGIDREDLRPLHQAIDRAVQAAVDQLAL